ncbi:methionyl-tRNA formyltransferase [Sphingobacterium nematocida]|uniref:Methionyl-tRNA formyltransferase n=1 Tax=Sphingobacterium nematocida TaxID=1513896 RepID=A0A1T5CPQ2_9SPHI|nr:methionyl-tRNA formyltransferase [Sphingobacterium nematocida]SKB61150.1 methionyl-tRNA formyltransferase [Sphingobacterium nematocida]
MRIIFMGTPDFAVASLKALLDAGENVVAVITSPDKPAGRGQKLHQSAVKQFALKKNLPILQPEKLKDPTFLESLKSYKADLQVVVAFRMLPQVVWDMPPMGTINVHASLLPQYRGAAPINHAIINGEKETGVSTFLLQHEIDTGNILLSQKVKIEDNDTAGLVHDKLMDAGAKILIDTVNGLRTDSITPIPQENISTTEIKHAPKIFKEDCLVDWNKTTREVYNKIRGLSPYPAAYTLLDGKVLKIYEVTTEIAFTEKAPGSFDTDGKSFLKFCTQDGYINLLSLQIEGKKRMSIEEFLRGYRFD